MNNYVKQFHKRGLALFLALIMCLSLVQVTAFAEDADFSDESQITDVNDVDDAAADFEEELPPECICAVFCTDEAVNYNCPVCFDNRSMCMGEPAPAIPEHEHFFELVSETVATCTQDGEKVSRCACGELITETIPATGHTSVVIEGAAATETEAGLTDGLECVVCGEVLVAQEPIPTLESEAVVMTAGVQVFLDAVADLPEEIETNEQYDAVMAALPGISELYAVLSEDEQELDGVMAALGECG